MNLGLCQHYVCGVKLVDVVKVQIGVNREEPTDAFSSIREEFCSTRRIEPLAGYRNLVDIVSLPCVKDLETSLNRRSRSVSGTSESVDPSRLPETS